ncbi:type 3 dihydrofolate reductase [Chitinimonas sp.]|uniref:type 3 dihydrofolate reductase n=1 Tax=Chitinimonas sp. TaxID=1934313 RepID=UPI0035B08E79
MLSLIAALARNHTVGINNALPWHLPDDLKYFKATTTGKPIIMGRKTYDSIGRPLPGRHNIVVTRDANWQADGVTVVHSVADALAAAGDVPEVFLIGGATLYREALPLADRLYLTEIDADFEGDAHFPVWPREQFAEIQRETRQAADFAYSFVVYHRKT